MTIKIIKEPDLYLTEAEMNYYRQEYQRAFTHYAGNLPTFEEFVRSRKHHEKEPPLIPLK